MKLRSRWGPFLFLILFYFMNKFIGWLFFFFLLLITIPVLLFFGWVLPAKILGVFTVLLLSFSVRFWLYRTKKEFDPKERVRLNLNDRFYMKRELPFYPNMNATDQKALEDRMGVLLSRVPICLSSGELLHQRMKALKVAAIVVNEIGLGKDLIGSLPNTVIIETDTWSKNMLELKSQSNVRIIRREEYL
jgi:hypothetical protein